MIRRSSSSFLLTLLAALALAAVLAGCGAKAPAPDASLCDYLTPAQLQEAIGQPFGEPEAAGAATGGVEVVGSALCTYTSSAGPKAVLTIFKDSSPEAAKTAFDKFKGNFKVTSEPAGLGDAAYLDEKNFLHLLKGAYRVYLQLTVPGADAATLAAYGSQLGGVLAASLP
jgi:hypothetical protein